MARHKDKNWSMPEGQKKPDGSATHGWESIYVSLLMDIRDELKRLNMTLECRNTQAIPHTLARIDKRLAKSHPLK